MVAPLGFSSYPYSIYGSYGYGLGGYGGYGFGGYGGYGYTPFTSISLPAYATPYPPPLPASFERRGARSRRRCSRGSSPRR